METNLFSHARLDLPLHHDKDSEKIRRHRRYAKFSPIRHIQSKFQIPYTKRCDKKNLVLFKNI